MGLATLTCGTDNQGNSLLLDKLMTTKFPLGVVLMELACQLGLRRACLHARWIPRLQNEEADVTNMDFHHFDPKLRINVDLNELGFIVMDDLFREGDAYVEELGELKKAEQDTKRRKVVLGSRGRPVRKSPPLREKDPW